MTDDKYQYRYTYDAWNRLVKVEDQDDPPVVGAYAYDGLNRRITRTIGSDDAIHEYYTESWQRIESRPNGEASTQGVSLFVFGIRYIDDIIMRQRDANASGPPEERRYYLTDANYNVVMLVTDAGYGVERVFYTAYGEPEVFPFGDADGDYDVDSNDPSAASGSYKILADLNLDGVVNQTDLNLFTNYLGNTGGRGVLTYSNGSATSGNDIGYAGYTWNDERSQWHVRNREYDPRLGRWLQRDPAGYRDGHHFTEYVAGRPPNARDSHGLCAADDLPCDTPEPAKKETTPVVWPEDRHGPVDPRHELPPVTEQHKLCCSKFFKKFPPEEVDKNGVKRTIAAAAPCCGGKRIVCVWEPAKKGFPVEDTNQEPKYTPGKEAAWFAIDACVLEHERRHVGQTWHSCEGVPDGDPGKPGMSDSDEFRLLCEHCKILRAEVACLEKARSACSKLPNQDQVIACQYVVDRALARSKEDRDSKCKEAEEKRPKK